MMTGNNVNDEATGASHRRVAAKRDRVTATAARLPSCPACNGVTLLVQKSQPLHCSTSSEFMMVAAFSPIIRAVEYVFCPGLDQFPASRMKPKTFHRPNI